MTFVQAWLPPANANAATSKTQTGDATTAGNSLFLSVAIRWIDVTGAKPTVTVTDSSGTNTWTEVAYYAGDNSYARVFIFRADDAASITSVTASWVDTEEEEISAASSIFLQEHSGVAGLLDSSSVYVTGGGLGDAVTATAADQLVIATGGLDTYGGAYTITGSGVSPTEAAGFAGQQLLHRTAYAYTTAAGDVAIGWDSDEDRNVITVLALFDEGEAGPAQLSVNAGADQSIYVGQTASVSASATGGTAPYSYAWTVVSGSGSFLNANQANTTFTPSGGAGTRVLRCIVTDANSAVAQDDLTVTVSQAPEFVTVASVNDATGWTATGGTVVQVLSDTSDNTLITSQDNPTEQVLDVNSQAVTINPGQHFVARVRARRGGAATTGTVTGYLYTGTTLHSTVEGRPIPGSMGDVDITFPASTLTGITPQQWADGVRFVAEVTASS